MKRAVIYIHGQGGSAEEAEHYRLLFKEADVIGFAYKAGTPREAKAEFPTFFDSVRRSYETVSVVANSTGAYFTMTALSDRPIDKAWFISPIVNMETCITDRMIRADVTEKELETEKQIETAFGETLSWEYLCYVRSHPVKWTVSTDILYGENDRLTSYETILQFAEETGAAVAVMKDGEHWFHTDEQMRFLDGWIRRFA